MTYSASDFANDTDVSRETLADYQVWHDQIQRWNAKINLVSKAALEDFWFRHALDSWQITEKIPQTAESVLDFGSGGGFPGIAVAIHCKAAGQGRVTMVESVGKKANFLKSMVRTLKLPAGVRSERIEALEPMEADVITARAFAPLPRLFEYAAPFWAADTVGVFHKGENCQRELTNAQKTWHFDVESYPSLTDPVSVILKIKNLRPRTL
jgi:16S rRNA (guanine527-N7)-methyltransferase